MNISKRKHKSARKNFPRRRIIIKDLDDLLQMDLVHMDHYTRVNFQICQNFKYIPIVIDCFYYNTLQYLQAYESCNSSRLEV